MTVVRSDSGMYLMLGQERLDLLARALGAQPVRMGGPLPALWHWTTVAPACALGTSVRVRLFRAPRAGIPVALSPPNGTDETSSPRTLTQDGHMQVQTLTSRLPGAHPGSVLEASDVMLACEAVDVSQLLSLFSAAPAGSAVNRVLGLLAAHRLVRRMGGQLAAIEFNFWSAPARLRSCRQVASSDGEGRVLFRVGGPDEPAAMTGTAWFGCGPGPGR
jgi:hypothetical protein